MVEPRGPVEAIEIGGLGFDAGLLFDLRMLDFAKRRKNALTVP